MELASFEGNKMEKKTLKKGLFITFEGPEGCGKSTQSKLLTEFLEEEGYHVLHTYEPGGTYIGKKIREILLDPGNKGMADFSELFLFEAARAQIVDEIIKPALKKKFIVISDRFNDATHVYQSLAGKISLDLIKKIEKSYLKGFKPDLTILLDIDAEEGLKRSRIKGEHDRMERKGLDFHKKVRAGYLKLQKLNPKRIKLVKVMEKMSDTQDHIQRIVENVIQRY